MIIQKQKAFETILDALGGQQNIFLVGCSDCATTCKTGGEEELAEMKSRLEAAGKTVNGAQVCETACLRGEVRSQLSAHKAELDGADAVLVMACGTGAQTVGDQTDLPVHPGCDSLFIGEVIRQGKFTEKCSACGACILEETGGICPVTRCSKGLMNGPCGGYNADGKCEVDPEKDCAWILIYERLRERGQLDKLRKMQPAKDHAVAAKPRLHEWERPDRKAEKAAK